MLNTPILGYNKPQDVDPVDELPFDTNFDISDAATGIQKLTQAQINALTAAQSPDGIVVYNTTTGQHLLRQNGAWIAARDLTFRLAADVAANAGGNIPNLSAPIAAGQAVNVEAYLAIAIGATSSNNQLTIVGPAGAALVNVTVINGSGAAQMFSALNTIGGNFAASQGLNQAGAYHFRGLIVNGANAGNIQLAITGAANNTVKAGSYLRLVL